MGLLYSCLLSFVILYNPALLRRVTKGYWILLVSWMFQSSCLHYMPRGVSNTLDYMHVSLSYYIGAGTLYQGLTSLWLDLIVKKFWVENYGLVWLKYLENQRQQWPQQLVHQQIKAATNLLWVDSYFFCYGINDKDSLFLCPLETLFASIYFVQDISLQLHNQQERQLLEFLTNPHDYMQINCIFNVCTVRCLINIYSKKW